MKHVIYRILAAAIVLATGYTAFLTVADRDFRAGFPFGILAAVLGFLLIVPTFTAYAFGGEKAANPVLVFLLKLLHLPDAILGRIAQRYVELPSELNQPRHEGANPVIAKPDSTAQLIPDALEPSEPNNAQ